MLLIRNSNLVDWRKSSRATCDILIDDGVIKKIDTRIDCSDSDIIEAKGLVAIPGIVDPHVHLRQPGYEWKETVESGVLAATSGGVTSLCAMPNVMPCPDSVENYHYVRSFQKDTVIRVLQSCSINQNLSGRRNNWKELYEAGAIVFTNDGLPVDRNSDMAAALWFSRETGVLVAEHPEIPEFDKSLGNTEHAVICRDVILNERIGGRLHLQHVSLASSIDFLKQAREKNIRFTIETCPHYFIETSEGLPEGFYEVYPPIRTADDLKAIRWAIVSGLIDIIASDHAPHTLEEKTSEVPARGFSGVELLFPLSYTALVSEGLLSLQALTKLLTFNSSNLLGINPACLEEGERADIVLFDPNESWIVEESSMYSKGKNTPFLGKKLDAKVKYTIASGRIVYPFTGESV